MPSKSLLRATYWTLRAFGAAGRRLGRLWATALHRATLGSVGQGARFQLGVRFAQPGIVHIGRDCYFWRGVHASAEIPGAPLHIADQVQINQHVHLDTTGGLAIGARVMISEGVMIYTHDHGRDPRATPVQLPKIIENDVWIGAHAIILPQCRRIGAEAIIGAGAVVTRDVRPGAIIGGNPARELHARPAAEVAA